MRIDSRRKGLVSGKQAGERCRSDCSASKGRVDRIDREARRLGIGDVGGRW